ncbi:type I-U CRISPR-associated helicase/endonuclease Cas3 [Kitasatospora sp. NA04385]|uniref:type I-G CRISPR-associated helicase/endonuclease Cas3g n=1 Tax=Kitasatospora sp. NA04385 TaxID=2742135 RepID=UPI00159240E5|nr:type I-U CRISPR-associated helicase/endonuclease Cas3 [Kitasatospora sp. NA04385]QKW22341.1 type I-U CRISPR-associated helicase/endonuclease Cas3 [Kitasatospora sp. NA04385]
MAEFPTFFREVHHHTHCPDGTRTAVCDGCEGWAPFPWQSAYLDAVADRADWPDLDVPTALGKTTFIDIWIFLLAWEHARRLGREHRRVPLRLFFCVDRRLVVDQAHQHSLELAAALAGAPDGSVRAKVAASLRDLGGGALPLDVLRMRGGTRWESNWVRSPAQPLVVTSTVDQYGSRLLFRGYHTSPQRAPIDAALTGYDALLALDEAHLSKALLATAADTALYQQTATRAELALRALRVVSLSATSATGGRPRLGIGDADRAHPIAGRRIAADRHVTLLDASSWSKKPAEAFALAAETGLDAVLPLLKLPAVAVIANTITHARATHEALSGRTDVDVLLLTGRCRPAERDLLVTGPLAELLTGIDPDRERPLVVISTQTLEVGIDCTFGAMVSECGDWASALQRLGRLDRRGELGPVPAILVRTHNPEDPDRIPVYGPAAAHTWQWLTQHAPAHDTQDPAELTPHLLDGLVLNPATLPGLLDGTDTAPLTRAGEHIPPVHRVRVDAFARTSPIPVPDESPAPFLHGLDTGEPEVQLLWRADLPTDTTDPDTLVEHLRTTPVHTAETLSLPLAAVRRSLTEPRRTPDTSDLEGPDADTTPEPRNPPTRLRTTVLQREADGTWTTPRAADDLKPGATLVLPTTAGGHDAYGWTADPNTPVPDLGDHPADHTRTPLRLDPAVLASTTGTAPEQFAPIVKQAITDLTTDPDAPDAVSTTDAIRAAITSLLATLPTDTAPDGPARHTPALGRRLEGLLEVAEWRIGRSATAGAVLVDRDGQGRIVLLPPRLADAGRYRISVDDGDPDSSSLTRTVTLQRHHQTVGERARDFARAVGLPDDLVGAVVLAARAHDCGKHHPRFQCMLCSGDRLLAESLPEPLAKSGMDPADRAARRRAAHLANWSKDLRHEALSAAAVQTWLATDPDAAQGLDHDLVIHLVAAHHGYARPMLPAFADPEPVLVECTMPDDTIVTVSSTTIGTDWNGPDRFDALNQRYGPWGLALLESVVRLADIACSEEGN